ncbi:MAG: YicC/YloC family endoribonuclease [Bacteroidales bacterium]|nr:YicC/YloC family endoribonuclease [Bacteroidales bacterium]
MLMSMTGFGKASAEAQGKKITVEVKSLNSKQLDLNARMPSVFRQQEIDVRNLVARELERGKVDLIVTVESVAGATIQSHVNVEVLAAYRDQIREAANRLGIAEPADWFPVLMRMPDVMVSDQADEVSPEMAEALIKAVGMALDGLKAHRRAEGMRLEEFFATRIEGIRTLLSEIEPYEAERVPRIRARIEDALGKIPVAEYDKGRLEQEMIFYIEKLDVNEEKQRLAQHLAYFLETMDGNVGQGKKLGFIAQEMGREINTLGSKSNHAEMQCIVVRMKDMLEQIKEQVLNVM